MSPMSMWRSVVLPAPLGPTSATTEPAGIVNEQSWRAQSDR